MNNVYSVTDIIVMIFAIIVISINVKMISYINKSYKETQIILALYKSNIEYGNGTENTIHQKTQWGKIKLKHKRKLSLIQAGITPENAKTKDVKKLSTEQLYTLAALREKKPTF